MVISFDHPKLNLNLTLTLTITIMISHLYVMFIARNKMPHGMIPYLNDLNDTNIPLGGSYCIAWLVCISRSSRSSWVPTERMLARSYIPHWLIASFRDTTISDSVLFTRHCQRSLSTGSHHRRMTVQGGVV